MIDHISLGVTDVARSRGFYDAVLATLGHERLFDVADQASAYGPKMPIMRFWIGGPLDDGRPPAPCNGTHVAFEASDRAMVRAFHQSALEAGGSDAGAPGLRPQYGPTYYGAYALDPDGHKIEAVCYAPE
jgi:catechol 2,3-dioxygenase-like lactoylglutathione lyase family enzyme